MYGTISTNLDLWVRELSRAGLPAPAQQELLRRLAWAIGTRTKYFPNSPPAYVGSMKELLLSTFLPQKGPIVIANDPGSPPEIFFAQQSMGIGLFGTLHARCEKPPIE